MGNFNFESAQCAKQVLYGKSLATQKNSTSLPFPSFLLYFSLILLDFDILNALNQVNGYLRHALMHTPGKPADLRENNGVYDNVSHRT